MQNSVELVKCERCGCLIPDGSSTLENEVMFHCEICGRDICTKCLENIYQKKIDEVCDMGIVCHKCK